MMKKKKRKKKRKKGKGNLIIWDTYDRPSGPDTILTPYQAFMCSFCVLCLRLSKLSEYSTKT